MSAALLQVVGTVMTVIGTISSAKASSDAASFNAQIARQNAAAATAQGEANAEQQRRINQSRISSIQAGFGASGIKEEGSPLDVLASSAAQAELEVQIMRYNSSLKATGFLNNAALNTSQASSALTSGVFTAAGKGLLGGVQAREMFIDEEVTALRKAGSNARRRAYAEYTSGRGTGIPLPTDTAPIGYPGEFD